MISCSISNQPIINGVVSKISGHVYEKDMILNYINLHKKCPFTDQQMTEEDLIVIQSESPQVKYPFLQSLQNILSQFQAISNENFELKSQVSKLKQELSYAMYLHDASLSLISKLIKNQKIEIENEQIEKLQKTENKPKKEFENMIEDLKNNYQKKVQLRKAQQKNQMFFESNYLNFDQWSKLEIQSNQIQGQKLFQFNNSIIIQQDDQLIFYNHNFEQQYKFQNELILNLKQIFYYDNKFYLIIQNQSLYQFDLENNKFQKFQHSILEVYSEVFQVEQFLLYKNKTNKISVLDLNENQIFNFEKLQITGQIKLHPDSKLIFEVIDKNIIVYNLHEQSQIFEIQCQDSIQSISLSNNSFQMIVQYESSFEIYNLKKQTFQKEFKGQGFQDKSGRFIINQDFQDNYILSIYDQNLKYLGEIKSQYQINEIMQDSIVLLDQENNSFKFIQ